MRTYGTEAEGPLSRIFFDLANCVLPRVIKILKIFRFGLAVTNHRTAVHVTVVHFSTNQSDVSSGHATIIINQFWTNRKYTPWVLNQVNMATPKFFKKLREKLQRTRQRITLIKALVDNLTQLKILVPHDVFFFFS